MRWLRSLVIACLIPSLLFSTFAVGAADLALPTGDLVAPNIQHDPISQQFRPGEPAEIRATVTDNVGVGEVVLFYRTVGTDDYKRLRMSREGQTDEYVARLPEVPTPAMEYYIQATDVAGNTLLRGHSFSPMTLRAAAPVAAPAPEPGPEPAPAAAAYEPPAPAEEEKEGGVNWIWVVLGVLAVGGIAAAASGGGGGDDSPPPATTTININAPFPAN